MDKARTILLTGTGTIGSELLLALVRGTSHRVYVLFRNKGDRGFCHRASLLFERLGLTTSEIHRISILEGDVTEKDFGLDRETIDNLTNELDFLIHTAATTSLTADEILCEAVNVGGTRNAIDLARNCRKSGKLGRFVHLSTVFVVGDDSSTRVLEDELPDLPHHFNFYESSKYKAEQVVRTAMGKNLPSTIFRPSMVVGDTHTGWTRDFNVIYPLIRMLSRGYISHFPADPNGFVHLAPINFVVDAIVESLEKEWTCGKTFNLTSPAPVTVAEIFTCKKFFQSEEHQPKLYPPETFDWEKCSVRETELLESVSFCLPYFNSRHLFETANTERLTRMPKIDGNYLNLLGMFAQQSGYLKEAQNGN
jgi:long-chain acyl-CoA synthetase